MRIVFVIIVFLHGLLHSLGFIHAFSLIEVKGMTLPMSKPIGVLWLVTTILFVIYVILYLTHSKHAWWVGLVAVVLSQILIILLWKDARFGTIPNIIILAVALCAMSYQNFQSQIQRETTHLLQQNPITADRVIQESDLSTLPDPVQRWLRRSGMVGRPFISVGRIVQDAEMQMKPGKGGWKTAQAIQFSTVNSPAFIWKVNVNGGGLMSFQGRDIFEDGHGNMTIKVNSVIKVVDAKGDKLDEAILQSYLGEMVWFPSVALSPYITWHAIDENTATATMSYKGTSGSGTFFFDTNGYVTKYSALRYKDNDDKAKRYVWEMDIQAYDTFDGIRIPSEATSTWKLEEGDWTWLKIKVVDVKYNQKALDVTK